MSFRRELAGLANAASEEFGEEVWHIPTLRAPNGRPAPDPARPAYPLVGIFDPGGKAGNEPGEASLAKEFSGRHRPMIPTLTPTLTVHAGAFRYQPVQGDEVVIVADGERYRVLDHVRAMQGMTRLHLEQLGRPAQL